MYGRPSGVSITCPDHRCVNSTSGSARRDRALERRSTHGIRRLPGLVIHAAEDDGVEVALRIEPEIMVRIPVSQKSASGTAPGATRPPIDVARIKRELGLKRRRADQAGDADERIVRRDDDVAGTSPCRRWLSGSAADRENSSTSLCS